MQIYPPFTTEVFGRAKECLEAEPFEFKVVMKKMENSVWRDGIGFRNIEYMVIEINWQEDI